MVGFSVIISLLSFPLSSLVASLALFSFFYLFISYYLFTVISIVNIGGISGSIIVFLLSFPLSTLVAYPALLLSLYFHFYCQLWWHLFISYYLFTIISIVNFGGISGSIIVSLLSFSLTKLVASPALLLSLYYHFYCQLWWHLFISYYLYYHFHCQLW